MREINAILRAPIILGQIKSRRPTMFRLTAIVYVLTATAIAGTVVTGLLTANVFDRASLAMGAVAGAIVAMPAAWLIARQLYSLTRQ